MTLQTATLDNTVTKLESGKFTAKEAVDLILSYINVKPDLQDGGRPETGITAIQNAIIHGCSVLVIKDVKIVTRLQESLREEKKTISDEAVDKAMGHILMATSQMLNMKR